MRVYYDLHIHSALSPCGDEDMTPNNIVNMALIKGLDVIALTDHNSCGNVRAVMEVAGDKLLVIPAMEVETAEEVHVLCYFPTIEAAEAMWEILKLHRLSIKNKPEIFGHQFYMNADDQIVGEEDYLLVTSCGLSIDAVISHAKKLGGVAVPAHIDRTGYSVISNLGFLAEEWEVTAVEITGANLEKWSEDWKNYTILSSSDAHYLGDVAEATHYMDIKNKNVEEILDILTNKKN